MPVISGTTQLTARQLGRNLPPGVTISQPPIVVQKVNIPGPPGPPGKSGPIGPEGTGNTYGVGLALTFASPHSQVLLQFGFGWYLTKIHVDVSIAFNAPSKLRLGTTGALGTFLAGDDVNLEVAHKFSFVELHTPESGEFLILTFSAHGATEGAATFYYEYSQ